MAYSVSHQNTFKESKEEIIKIYSEVFNYVNDSDEFLRSIHNSGAVFQALINADDEKSLSKSVEKVKSIQSVISRDNMKCAFFGRTSNGKSTTINALLGDSLLPADMGHTTSCFIEIRGTKDSQGSVSIISPPKPGSNSPPVELVGKENIDSVLERAEHSCEDKLPTDSLIRIAWPSQKCALLSKDVVILDSPGIDLDPDIDKCIDKYCLDADVFVLVVNGTATITKAEKDFFHKVCEKLSKPNVFILNNYWDKSAKNRNYLKKREQHMEKCVDFLTNVLKVCSETEAENRVFFVSAKEVLNDRNKKNEIESGVPTSLDSSGSKPLREGWQSRLSEFIDFEEILGKTLSESASKTKFAAHSSQGQEIVTQVRCIVEALNEKAKKQNNAAVTQMNKIQTCIDTLTTMRSVAYKESISDISCLSVKILKMVAKNLHNEVQHLGDVIDRFNQKFRDDPSLLNQYQRDLIKHVKGHLGNTMKSFWDSDLRNEVQVVSTAILKRYQALVQVDDVTEAMCKSVCNDYVSEFDMDCRSISSDFQENLPCQSSLDLTNVVTAVSGAMCKSACNDFLPILAMFGVKDVHVAKLQLACNDRGRKLSMDGQSKSSDFQENLPGQSNLDLTNVVTAIAGAMCKSAFNDLLPILAMFGDKDVPVANPQLACNDRVRKLVKNCQSKDFSCQSSFGLKSVMTDLGRLPRVNLSTHNVQMAGLAVVAVGCGVALMKYGYDNSTRKMDAKEKALKAQIGLYMTEHLKPLIAQNSKRSTDKPQLALKTTLEKLEALVEKHEQNLQADIAQLKIDIQQYEEIVAKSQNLTDTAHTLENELKGFDDKYILV